MEKMVETNTAAPINGEDSETSPLVLSIYGPPSILNNIVFAESDGNMLIQQHEQKPWNNLSVKQLLNWPYVSVELNLPNLTLSRTNLHEYERYITLDNKLVTPPKTNHICYCKKISDDSEHKLRPFSYNFIKHYMKQFISVINTIPGIKHDRVRELDAIFLEYRADIEEANYSDNTVCTNIAVGYHIGKSHYARNKKMAPTVDNEDNENASLNFYEILTPQMEYALHSFDPIQDRFPKRSSTFQSLNILIKLLSEDVNHKEIEDLKLLINNTGIVYHCTFCKETFSGPRAQSKLRSHFNEKHQDEQPVLCVLCCQLFHIRDLAAARWKHVCDPGGTNAVQN